jgi:ribonuclease VapC
MVIDTSAIVAILLAEPEDAAFARAIMAAPTRLMSAVSWVECSMVMTGRQGAPGLADLDRMVARARIEVTPVQLLHAQLAREAFDRFGRGRHPAKLNCGDCFAYALAKATGEPLLFKGDDFGRTDIRTVTV